MALDICRLQDSLLNEITLGRSIDPLGAAILNLANWSGKFIKSLLALEIDSTIDITARWLVVRRTSMHGCVASSECSLQPVLRTSIEASSDDCVDIY